MDTGTDLAAQATRVGALADPTRRALYEYVVAHRDAVGREAAAAALDLPLHSVKLHLDRLVAAGLLVAEFRRLGERTGPGAGRTSKLYRRAAEQVAISLPDRKYDLVGHILASGVERAGQGTPLGEAIDAAAAETGRSVGAAAAPGDADAFTEVLAGQGFEPQVDDGVVLLANCPFDTLAKTHPALVCGLNRAFVQGVADGLGCDLTACLEPEAGLCCVKVRPAEVSPAEVSPAP
jgi:predicted ArsR family transcriptional regulator